MLGSLRHPLRLIAQSRSINALPDPTPGGQAAFMGLEIGEKAAGNGVALETGQNRAAVGVEEYPGKSKGVS